MAKRPTINTVSSGYNALATLNSNFTEIQGAFDNTLSRDGSTPNAMNADLDMNSNDILNAKNIDAESVSTDRLTIAGSAAIYLSPTPAWKGAWTTSTPYTVNDLVYIDGSTYICVTAHTSGTFATDLSGGLWEIFAYGVAIDRFDDTFSGDGSTVAFVLSQAVPIGGFVDIFVHGVRQEAAAFSFVGDTVTFTTAPPLGTNNIEIAVIGQAPSGYLDSASITYSSGETGSVARTVEKRLRDRISVTDFGVTDGGSDDTVPIQAAMDTTKNIWFPAGAWNGTTVATTNGNMLEADTGADLSFTFDAPLRKGNRFTFGGDYEPTLGQLGHPAPNKGNSWQNALQVTRGTLTNPDTTALYARTAVYVEMHSGTAHSVSQSSWGSPYKTPALTVENIASSTFLGEANGAAFRAYSTATPASAATNQRNLVGVSAIGQTNSGAGNDAWSVWGANFVAAETSGNAANNCVGIEVDLVHVNGAVAASGPSVGNNYTAYWAQSDAQGVYSTAAFYWSRSAGSLGWNYGVYGTTACRDWAVYIENPSTVAAAGGIFVETSSATANALLGSTAGYNTTSGNGPNVMNLKSQASGVVRSQMVVTSNASNPINIRVGGGLETVLVGAADSAGAGFRMLRVAN